MKKRFVKNIFILIFIVIIIGICLYAKKLYTKNLYEKKLEYEKALEYEKSIEGMKITLLAGSNKKENGNINSNGYIIRTRNNKLIIVDGGRTNDAKILYEYITKYGNKKVDYWYITHPHEDHVEALLELLNGDYNLEIENLYYSFNSLEWYEKNDKRGFETEKTMLESLNNPKIKNLVECYKGQIIEMDNIECDIIRVANPKITHSDNGNDSSMVFKMTAKDVDKSIIFLGDAYTYASKELMERPDKLSSYAVQMAHHGQNGVTKEIYDAINPKICFFNAPEWLYNNDNGNGYNSGKWQSIIVREWMKEKNTINFVAYEGDQTIRLTRDGFEKIDE